MPQTAVPLRRRNGATPTEPPRPEVRRAPPRPRGGLLHVLDAAGYSLAGLRRLLAETAARLEVGGAAAGALLLLWHGATPAEWLGFGGLVLALLATEALNTAIEVLTDRISPEWSIEARHAKDLGSLAVGLVLVALIAYLAAVLGRWI